MIATRERLPNRRASETFEIEIASRKYRCSISHYADGRLAEIFLSNNRMNSDSDTAARDSAIVDRASTRRSGRRYPARINARLERQAIRAAWSCARSAGGEAMKSNAPRAHVRLRSFFSSAANRARTKHVK
jgi:hypothetical protein